ncbi:hypothetical protein MMC27_000238, partial [Xylographa pallens]|nr:hypothetical protein [Xylographa pallens]
MFFDYRATVLYWLQIPAFGSQSSQSASIRSCKEYVERFGSGREPSPFDSEFEALVNKTLHHYKVPGVAIAVLNGNSTFAR